MKQNKLTKQQHKEFGAKLKQATDATVLLQALTANAYGRTCRARSLAEKANTALLHLRSELDSLAASENPSDPAIERYYFGADVANSTQSA